MNEQPIENMDAAATEDRAEWVRPEILRMKAGDAETAAAAAFEGTGFS